MLNRTGKINTFVHHHILAKGQDMIAKSIGSNTWVTIRENIYRNPYDNINADIWANFRTIIRANIRL